MHLTNLPTTRRVLDEWAAQGFRNDSYGIVMDAELESFNTTIPRLVLKAFRRGSLIAIIYGYQTLANMSADVVSRANPNVGALVFADATNANNDLYFSNAAGAAWVADALWGMSNAFKTAITALNASQTLQATTPTPGAPGAGVPADGVAGSLLGYQVGTPAWRSSAQAWNDLGIMPDSTLPARLRAQSLNVTDANEITENGPYRFAGTAANIPLNAASHLYHFQLDSANARQIWYRYNTSQAFERNMVAGVWEAWAQIYGRAADLNPIYARLASAAFTAPPQLPSFTVATVPAASLYPRGQAYISNGAGGKRIAFSDGTSWRWVGTEVVIS